MSCDHKAISSTLWSRVGDLLNALSNKAAAQDGELTDMHRRTKADFVAMVSLAHRKADQVQAKMDGEFVSFIERRTTYATDDQVSSATVDAWPQGCARLSQVARRMVLSS